MHKRIGLEYLDDTGWLIQNFQTTTQRRTKTVKRILIAVSILLVALSLPLSAETVKGYLIDKMCSAKVAKEGVDAAKAHTKDCALMADCKSSGYGVVNSDGKFLKFGADGDRMAAKMLGLDDREDNIKVSVSGTVTGSSMTVIAIQFTS